MPDSASGGASSCGSPGRATSYLDLLPPDERPAGLISAGSRLSVAIVAKPSMLTVDAQAVDIEPNAPGSQTFGPSGWRNSASRRALPQAPAPPVLPPAPPIPPPPASDAEKRRLDKVLAEIRETEQAYVDALSSLVAFLPLLQQHLQDVALLTSVGALQGVHRELLTRLDAAHEQRGRDDPTAHRLPLLWPNAKPSDFGGTSAGGRAADMEDTAEAEAEAAREQHVKAVATAFASLTPFLRAYSTHCSGYTTAVSRLADIRQKNKSVSDQLAALEKAHEPLDSLLIKPVQRLCKYPLFFGELLKSLPVGPVQQSVAASLEAVRKVSSEVNAKTAQSESSSRLFELHVALGSQLPELLSPTRSLVLELEVKLAPVRAGSMASARRESSGLRRNSLSGAVATAAATAAATAVARSSRKRFKVLLLSDAVVLARMRRGGGGGGGGGGLGGGLGGGAAGHTAAATGGLGVGVGGSSRGLLSASMSAASPALISRSSGFGLGSSRQLLSSLPSGRPRASSRVSSGTAHLKLKAVLPLEKLQANRAPSGERSSRRRYSQSRSSSTFSAAAEASSSASSTASEPPCATAQEKTATLLLLCRQPLASFSCKCADVAAADGLLAALEATAAKLQESELHIERRRSLQDLRLDRRTSYEDDERECGEHSDALRQMTLTSAGYLNASDDDSEASEDDDGSGGSSYDSDSLSQL